MRQLGGGRVSRVALHAAVARSCPCVGLAPAERSQPPARGPCSSDTAGGWLPAPAGSPVPGESRLSATCPSRRERTVHRGREGPQALGGHAPGQPALRLQGGLHPQPGLDAAQLQRTEHSTRAARRPARRTPKLSLRGQAPQASAALLSAGPRACPESDRTRWIESERSATSAGCTGILRRWAALPGGSWTCSCAPGLRLLEGREQLAVHDSGRHRSPWPRRSTHIRGSTPIAVGDQAFVPTSPSCECGPSTAAARLRSTFAYIVRTSKSTGPTVWRPPSS